MSPERKVRRSAEKRYARSNAEAARLGIPTYYQAKRSAEAAAARGVPQSVLRGHPRTAKGEVGLREVRLALRSLVSPPTVAPKAAGEPMLVVSGGQVIEVTPWHWTQRRAIARHWNAIDAAMRGDEAALRRYRGRVVAGVELEADLDVIEAMAAQGGLKPVAIYPNRGAA